MKFFACILMLSGLLFASEKEDLESEIENLTGKLRIEKVIELAEMIYDEDISAAKEYIEIAVEFSENSNEPVLLMKARSVYGDIFFYEGSYRKAGEEYKNSLKLAEELDDIEYLFDNCKQLGAVFYYLSDYKTASIFYHKALDIAEVMGDEVKKAHIFNDLGSIRDEMNDYEKALELYDKALDVYVKINDELNIAKVYNNIATTLNNKKEPKEAVEYFLKALEIYQRHGKENYIPIIHSNLGSIYTEQKQFDKAFRHLNKAEKKFNDIGDNFGLALIGFNYGKAYFYQNDLSRAENFFNKSIRRSERLGVKFLLRDNYMYKSRLDSVRSRFKSAYFNYNRFIELKDEILEEEKQRKINDLMSKYELAQKEKQTSSLIRDNAIKKLELDKQRQINNFFIILFVLLIGISYLAYRSYTLKSKNEELLKEYSAEIDNFNKKLLEEIEKTKKELNESNSKLVNAEKETARMDKLASLGTMVAGITHEIKNPTQVIKLSTDSVRLALNDLAVFIYALINLCRSRQGSPNEIKKLIEKHKVKKLFMDIKSLVISNQRSVDLIDRIVTSTLKISRFDIDSSKCCLNDIIEDVLVIIKNSIKHSSEIRLELEQDIPPVECNYQEIAQILINLLTNARDAVDSKEDDTEQSVITISSGFDGKRVYFEVSDNGIGMRDEDKERIFEPFYSTKSDGKGHGLGLYIAKNIADNYNADITIESEYEKGTKFRVKFPINKTEEADDVERN